MQGNYFLNKNCRIQFSSFIIFVLLALISIPQVSFAQCVWTAKVKTGTLIPSSCDNNGAFTIELTGTDYLAGKLTEVSYSLDNENYSPDPSFTGLAKGTYTVYVAAKCNSNIEYKTVTNISVTGTTPIAPGLGLSLLRNSLDCEGALGIARVNLTGNSKPYTITITDKPASYNGASSFTGITASYFDITELTAGDYTFRMTDNCGKVTAARSITIKLLIFDNGNASFISAAYPRRGADGACDKYVGQAPYINSGDWIGFNDLNTPFEFAMSIEDEPLTEYKKLTYYVQLDLPLPAGKTFKDYYGKSNFIKTYIRLCGKVFEANTKVGTMYANFKIATSYNTQCAEGAIHKFSTTDTYAICYPIEVKMINSEGKEAYTGTVNAPNETVSSPVIDFGTYTIQYTTKDGAVLSDKVTTIAPTATPYSVKPMDIPAYGLHNKIETFTFSRSSGNFQVGTTIELISGPVGYPYNETVKAEATYHFAQRNRSGGVSSNFYWPAGVYKWKVTDNCGSYFLDYTLNSADLYSYTPAPAIVTETCSGLVVTPQGSATNKGMPITGDKIYFKVLSGPSGSPTNTIQQGQSFTFQTPGVYKIAMSAYPNTVYIYEAVDMGITTVVYAPEAPTVDMVHSIGFVCIGEPDDKGQIKVVASKGTLPYTYSLYSKDQSTLIAQNLTGEFNNLSLIRGVEYIVKVADACGATSDAQTIKVLDLTTAQLVTYNKTAFCEGESLVATAISLPGATYQWFFKNVVIGTTSRLTIANLTDTNAGDYKVVITSGSCAATTEFTLPITVNSLPSLPLTGDVIASDFCIGQASNIIIRNSVLGLTYRFYDAVIDGILVKLVVGTGGDLVIDMQTLLTRNYYLEVYNTAGCSQKGERMSITLRGIPSPTIVSAIPTAPLCAGESNGSISIVATGGTGPYSVSTDGETWIEGNVLTGLPSGSVSVYVRDMNKCSSASTTLVIPATSPFMYTADIQDPFCIHSSTGRIMITPQGGQIPYSYFIEQGNVWMPTTATITDLAAGVYRIKVQDANNCEVVNTHTLAEPIPMELYFTNQQNSLCSMNTGAFTVGATGGIAPYEYRLGMGEWSSYQQFTNLAPGAYVVEVRDSKGCIESRPVYVESYLSNLVGRFSFSDGPPQYGIASHQLGSCLYLGDLDPNKIQTSADPTESASTAQNDDACNYGYLEQANGGTDLSQANFKLDATGALTATVRATNNLSMPANLMAWIDFNQNGKFDAGEASTLATVPTGTSDQSFSLVWSNAGAQIRNGATYMRIRITTDKLAAVDAVAPMSDGEVEDYPLFLKPYSLIKTAHVMGKMLGEAASIGDIIMYTIDFENHLPFEAEFDIIDPIPAHTHYMDGSAHSMGPMGMLDNVDINGEFTKAILWRNFKAEANSQSSFSFEAQVTERPENPFTVINIAYATRVGMDTINTSAYLEMASVTVDPLQAKDECAIVLQNGVIANIPISDNDTDPLHQVVPIATIDLSHTPQGQASINADGTMHYVAKPNFNGLDSVRYIISVPGSSATAWVRIVVVQPEGAIFRACANILNQLEVAAILGVDFAWSGQDGTPITNPTPPSTTANVLMTDRDTSFTLSATLWNGCMANLTIPVKVIKPIRHADIRIQVCPLPDRDLNLTAYIDTVDFVSIRWTGPHLNDGTISSAAINGTTKYQYEVKNFCHTDFGVAYVSPYRDREEAQVDTIVICQQNADRIHLTQLFGLEPQGAFAYSDLLKTHVSAAQAPFIGALFFDGTGAYTDPSLSGFEKPYKKDIAARYFEFTYTGVAEGCVGTVKKVIIITSETL